VTKSNLIANNLVRVRLSEQDADAVGKKKAKVYEISKKMLTTYILGGGKIKTSQSNSNLQSLGISDHVQMTEDNVVFLQAKNKSKHSHTVKIAVKKCNQFSKSLQEDNLILVTLNLTHQDVKKALEQLKGLKQPPGNVEADLLLKFVKEHSGKNNIYIYTSKDDRITTVFKE